MLVRVCVMHGPGSAEGWTALHALARHLDSIEMLQLLLSLGADVNRSDPPPGRPQTEPPCDGQTARVYSQGGREGLTTCGVC